MTLREKLEALAAEECPGADEYRGCSVYSAKAQAMAGALIMLFEEGLDYETWKSSMDQLKAALDRADGISAYAIT
jgi:hypothetical protein